ncbi:MAG: hypothetical protein GY928_34920 [Colwellia sp.]|nr:hypothetical protein [Colwellia sp.]
MAKSGFLTLDNLRELYNKITTPTIEELKSALRTKPRMTVFRKLSKLLYISSYSHRGKYYALVEQTKFDKTGLWPCGDAMFLCHGNLVETVHNVDYTEYDTGIISNLNGQWQPLVWLSSDYFKTTGHSNTIRIFNNTQSIIPKMPRSFFF